MAYLIPLRANDQSIRAYTVVDEVDFRRFGNKRWFLTGHHYAACSFHNDIREEQPRLHREILGLKRGDGLEADHINGNKLDNRKSNLRIVSHSQNNQNRSINCDNTSGYRGVSWSSEKQEWRAAIRRKDRYIHLGFYTDVHEAGRVASEWRAQHMPFSLDAQKEI